MSEKLVHLPIDIKDAELLEKLHRLGFNFDYRIDFQVHCYRSNYETPECFALLKSKISTYAGIEVWLNVIDNSDFGCGTTFKVEMGLKKQDSTMCWMFGKSSPFCPTIDAAYMEASYDILYKIMFREVPCISAWHVRNS